MSTTSRNTSAKLDRPFAPEVLKRAEGLAEQYQVIVSYEDGDYYGRGLEMPGVMADGKTPAAAFAATREALTFAIATLMEQGVTPPPPASEGQRTEQVNVRLSAEEKLELDSAARLRGLRGVADFIRGAALTAARTAPVVTPLTLPAMLAASMDDPQADTQKLMDALGEMVRVGKLRVRSKVSGAAEVGRGGVPRDKGVPGIADIQAAGGAFETKRAK